MYTTEIRLFEDDDNVNNDETPKTQQNDIDTKVESKKSRPVPNQKSSVVMAKVFDQLGKPKDLIRYSAVNVYWNRWRINIIRRTSDEMLCFEAGKTTDSFFIHLSPEGEITYANPPISRRY
jgi:hypothetical protein